MAVGENQLGEDSEWSDFVSITRTRRNKGKRPPHPWNSGYRRQPMEKRRATRISFFEVVASIKRFSERRRSVMKTTGREDPNRSSAAKAILDGRPLWTEPKRSAMKAT